jgi:hypothetical protein
MSRIFKTFIGLVLTMMVSVTSYAQNCTDKPVINSFEPNTGFIGSVVEVFGANFDSNDLENNVVYFGATKAEVISATFGKLEVVVPVGASTAPISVTNQCNLTAISALSFNGIFCPTPLDETSYDNVAQELAVDYGAYNMLSQDMDLDGRPEVISSSNGGGISIAINNSTPGNLSFSKYEQPNGGGQSIVTADFDGDGLKDILWTYGLNRNISTGPGNIGLANSVAIPSISNYQVAAGDFNNDGKIDIIGIRGESCGWNSTCYYAIVAFNTSTGPGNISFGPAQIIANVGAQGNGLQAADIDGDGKVDFIASQRFANRAVSIRNTTPNGSFTFSAEVPEYWSSDSDGINGVGTDPYRSQLADFDKDGKIDFTSCNFGGVTNTAIWRNISTVGNINFAPTVNLPAPIENYRIQVGDVDGDGYPDIVTKSLGDKVFAVYRNSSSQPGTITFDPKIEYRNSPAAAEVSGIVIGDLDGDFVPDIATSGINTRTIRFHRNTSSQDDNDAPTAIAQNVVVALSPQGTVTVTAEQVNDGSSDACGIDTIVLSQTEFTCNDIGENAVTLTVTDNAGNVSTATAIVNVQPAAIIVSGQTTVCQGETIPLTANLGDSYQWFRNGASISGATNQAYTATETGAYTVLVTNAGGCSGISLATDVVVNENPTVDILQGANAYLCSGVATLSASQSSIYQWMKDGVDIPNATQQVYTTSVVGNYSVRVIDLFGCSAVSGITTVTDGAPEIDLTNNGVNVSTGATVNYGNVLPGVNNIQTVIVNNTGANPLDISQINVNGADAADFTISGAPSSVAANSSATFDIVFFSNEIRAFDAIITLVSNDCDEGNITLNVSAEITCLAASIDDVSNIQVNTDLDVCGATVSYVTNVQGNPDADVTYSFSGATQGSGSGTGTSSLFNVGTTQVTVTVANACGNDSTTFEVVVNDVQAPVISTQGATIQLDQNGFGSIILSDILLSSADACGILTETASQLAFDCTNVGANTVTVTVTDNNGQITQQPVTVTVLDVLPIVAQDDAFTLATCEPITFTTAQLLGNDSDPYNETLKIDFVDQPSSGSIIDNGNGTYTYTPGQNTNHTATASYLVKRDDGTIVNPDNGHFYEFVSASAITWTAAKVAAEARTYNGLQGYLATITSAEENAFAFSKVNAVGWIGASDAANEGQWVWAVGPEAGQPLNGNYSNWGSGEPNNAGNEDYAHFRSDAKWNDLRNSYGTYVQGYVVEYGGNTGDCNIESTATANISFTLNDIVAPVASAKNISVDLDAAGNASIVAADVDNGSSDTCGVATLTINNATFDCSNVGPNTVTLTVMDVNGNTNTAQATVTVNDVIAPDITAAADMTINTDSDTCGAELNFAGGGELFAVNGGASAGAADGGAFMSIDMNTGLGTVIGTPSPGNGITSLAKASDGTFYAITDKKELITIDPNTGNQTSSRGFTPDKIVDMSIQPGTDQIYAVTNSNTLVKVDANTAQTTLVGNPVGSGSFMAIAFGPNGLLYGLRTNQASDLLVIDPNNGTVTNSIVMSRRLGALALAVSPDNGLVYFSECCQEGLGNNIYTIDPSNGDVVFVGVAGSNRRVQDFAFGGGNAELPEVSDNCAISSLAGVRSDGLNLSDLFPLGGTTITWTVTDVNGNSSSDTQVITVEDNEAAEVITTDITIELDVDGNASITTGMIDNGSNDA